METPKSELALRIEGMDCADCALTLERGVARLEGVEHVQVNFTTATLEAVGTLDPKAIVERVHALGYQVEDDNAVDGYQQVGSPPPCAPTLEATAAQDRPVLKRQPGGVIGFARYLWQDRSTAVALVGAVLLLLSVPLTLLSAVPILTSGVRGLHILIMLLAGFPIAQSGLRSLLLGRRITIDLLMTIAATGAVLIGETGEAATVVVLFAIGEAMEAYTADRARDSLRSLLALRPDRATVLRPCLDCREHLGKEGYTGGPCPFCGTHEVTLSVEQVQVGETVLVRPGERIPVDGVILSGSSTVDQAPVTGESVPVSKFVADDVYAGTINGEGALEIEVSHLAADSTISRIVRLVETAQSQRSPAERFIDRFARWYTPAVVFVAFALATVPPLLFGAPFLDTPQGTRGWLYRALSLLIVACPCSLVISTPVTVVSAMTVLARRGVLVKGGAFLDALARVKVYALDKTGTLTRGQPRVVETRTLDCSLAGEGGCEACDEMLALASSVERRSEHPLARAILSEAESRDIHHRYPAATEVRALAGQGIEGTLDNAKVTIGNHALFHERQVDCTLHEQIQSAEAEGRTVMLVDKENRLLGFIGAADVLRETSRDALHALKKVDPKARAVMLTGDTATVAQAIAGEMETIDEVRAGLLPDDKLHAIRNLQEQYGSVAMIGDGVNDAPALAAADIGIAMGGAGTAQAMETADLVLMQDDLGRLPDAVQTSRRARRIIRQNVVFSLAVKAIILALALGGQATLWMAVFVDVGTSLLVTLNGMRMLRQTITNPFS